VIFELRFDSENCVGIRIPKYSNESGGKAFYNYKRLLSIEAKKYPQITEFAVFKFHCSSKTSKPILASIQSSMVVSHAHIMIGWIGLEGHGTLLLKRGRPQSERGALKS
jgi:hypothetical protein